MTNRKKVSDARKSDAGYRSTNLWLTDETRTLLQIGDRRLSYRQQDQRIAAAMRLLESPQTFYQCEHQQDGDDFWQSDRQTWRNMQDAIDSIELMPGKRRVVALTSTVIYTKPPE